MWDVRACEVVCVRRCVCVNNVTDLKKWSYHKIIYILHILNIFIVTKSIKCSKIKCMQY